MASTAATAVPPLENSAGDGVTLFRLWVLRAAYLLLAVGLGGMIVPEILSHELTSRGVIASLVSRGDGQDASISPCCS